LHRRWYTRKLYSASRQRPTLLQSQVRAEWLTERYTVGTVQLQAECMALIGHPAVGGQAGALTQCGRRATRAYGGVETWQLPARRRLRHHPVTVLEL
jgi:hypothetical protein